MVMVVIIVLNKIGIFKVHDNTLKQIHSHMFVYL